MTQVEKCLDDHNLNRTRSSRISPKPVMEEEAMIEVCEEKDTSCGGCRGGGRREYKDDKKKLLQKKKKTQILSLRCFVC